MKRLLSSPLFLLLFASLILLSLSPGNTQASSSLIDLGPAARWEFTSAWRVQVSERDFISLTALAEGRARVERWSGMYQITYRPNPSLDVSLTAVRSGRFAQVETVVLAPLPERRVDTLRDAGWRSIHFAAGRRWISSTGTSWRLAVDASLCDFSGPCAPRLSGGEISLGRASDPVVWRAVLSLGRFATALSGGVDIVIGPALALGAGVRVSREASVGVLTAWWDQTFTFHLGGEQYVSVGLGLDLTRHEPSFSVGMDLPLGGRSEDGG